MVAHNRKLKVITLDIGGEEFSAQCKTWQLVNNTDDGDLQYTYAPDGAFREETDPDWSLTATFFADWRSDGVSRYMTVHDGETVAFQLDHHPDITGEHVRWSGDLVIKAPGAGGDARTTEETEVELACVGKPVDTYPS
jgi:hypothetical protein